jgi:hypothetical protein
VRRVLISHRVFFKKRSSSSFLHLSFSHAGTAMAMGQQGPRRRGPTAPRRARAPASRATPGEVRRPCWGSSAGVRALRVAVNPRQGRPADRAGAQARARAPCLGCSRWPPGRRGLRGRGEGEGACCAGLGREERGGGCGYAAKTKKQKMTSNGGCSSGKKTLAGAEEETVD